MIKFGHIEIFCSDVVRSVTFYQDVLGFEVTVAQSAELVWLQLGAMEMLLRKGTPHTPEPRYEDGAAGLVMYTDDVLAEKARLEARGLVFKGTVDSEKCFTFTDPDGNWFQLVDPGDH